MRACTIPSEEFSELDLQTINDCCSEYYQLFESLFGMQNCSYNLHVIFCHLLEIRTHGPLTETSAFKFESFYGEMRRSFVPGTVSPLKQILKNVLLKRSLSKHLCQNNIFITNYDTPLECNKLIYWYKQRKFCIYEVLDIENNNFTCNRIGLYPANFKDLPNIPWSKVGVFRKGGVSSDPVIINALDISGKVLSVDKYLITCPINVLNEK